MMRLVLQSPGASTLCILEVRVRPSRHWCCKAWLFRAITDAEEPSVNSARSTDRLPCTAAEKKKRWTCSVMFFTSYPVVLLHFVRYQFVCCDLRLVLFPLLVRRCFLLHASLLAEVSRDQVLR